MKRTMRALSSLPPEKVLLGVFLVCAVYIIGIRSFSIVKKDTLWHDESISYIVSSCNARAYLDNDLAGTSVKVSEWKRFLEISDPFCFAQITSELSETDIHPPLYFWSLHLWSLVVGVNLWTGPALNIPFSLLTLFFLFLLTRRVLLRPLEIALVISVYAFTPHFTEISLEARQYDLLTLLAVIMVWQIVRLIQKPKSIQIIEFVLLALTTMMGALTHFSFLYVIAASFIALVARAYKNDHRRGLLLSAALISGYLAANFIFPFYRVFEGNQEWLLGRFSIGAALARALLTILALFPYLHIFALGIGVLILYRLKRLKPSQIPISTSARTIDAIQITLLGSIIAGFAIVLYITLLSPPHAMGVKYLSAAWPFLAFLPVVILRLANNHKAIVVYFVFTALAINLAFFVNGSAHKEFDYSSLFQEFDLILIDSRQIGILPQVVWHVPDDKSLVASNQDELLASITSWVSNNSGEIALVLVEAAKYSEEKQIATLNQIKQLGIIPTQIGQLPTREGLFTSTAKVYSLVDS